MGNKHAKQGEVHRPHPNRVPPASQSYPSARGGGRTQQVQNRPRVISDSSSSSSEEVYVPTPIDPEKILRALAETEKKWRVIPSRPPLDENVVQAVRQFAKVTNSFGLEGAFENAMEITTLKEFKSQSSCKERFLRNEERRIIRNATIVKASGDSSLEITEEEQEENSKKFQQLGDKLDADSHTVSDEDHSTDIPPAENTTETEKQTTGDDEATSSLENSSLNKSREEYILPQQILDICVSVAGWNAIVLKNEEYPLYYI